ncbi:MAG: hypothetical protein GXY34_01640 [Syntrophomonadaceae bacterium]|nr:hypothetical protein [Syntrophomonadaceae bacterium]
MKIWFQSGSGYRFNPLWEEYGQNLYKQCMAAARPGTEVYVTGTEVHMTERDRYKVVQYYHGNQFMNNMLKAEAEGYDAFVMGCSFDERVDEGREMLDMPVIGIGQANLFLASMIGDQFAIPTCEPHIAQKYSELVRKYGLDSHYLRGPYIHQISENGLAAGLNSPEATAEGFKAVCKKAIDDGASVLIPVPASIYQTLQKAGVSNSMDGVTILDPVAVVIKFAEMMVDLKQMGIEVSRKLQVYGALGEELRSQLLNMYAPIFKINIPEKLNKK